MATITWPSALPQTFERGSYTESLRANVIVDEFEVGQSGTRRRATKNVFPASGSIFLTTEEWELLEDFLHNETLDRSQAFGFPAQGVTVTSPPAEWLVLMDKPPSRTWIADGAFWTVAISLVVLPT